MADALVSPQVGGAMWAVTAAAGAWCAREVGRAVNDRLVPLMGVLGAFVFCAQMLNFAIPLTGSSGHITGGLLLATLLGPRPAFIVMASVLTVQALFFGDGGLLALGCNIFNLGFIPAFVVWPLLSRPLMGRGGSRVRNWVACGLGGIAALLLGAAGVVIETLASGATDIPARTFAAFMLPIHLVIGIVEGLVTGAVVMFVLRTRPQLLALGWGTGTQPAQRLRPVLVTLLTATILMGGILSWVASTNPDGLEWSLDRAARVHRVESASPAEAGAAPLGTSAAALLGGIATLILAAAAGGGLRLVVARRQRGGAT